MHSLSPGSRGKQCVWGAASVLWLPYQAITFLVRSGGSALLPESPLGDSSRLLALVLLHHAPPVEAGLPNPFRIALQQLQVRMHLGALDEPVDMVLTHESSLPSFFSHACSF